MIGGFPTQITVGDEGVVATCDDSILLVSFTEPMDREAVLAFLADYDIRLESELAGTEEDREKSGKLINDSPTRFWIHTEEDLDEETFEELEAADAVEWIAPAYRRSDMEGREAYFTALPDRVVVELKPAGPQADADAMATLSEEFHLQADPVAGEDDDFLGDFRVMQLERQNGKLMRVDDERLTAQTVVSQMTESLPPNVKSVRTENQPMVSPLTAAPEIEPPRAETTTAEAEPAPEAEEAITHVPNDTFFTEQWDMDKIGAREGWNLGTASGSVTIGVLDTGCDLGHPDLTYDGSGFNAGTVQNDGSPVGNHGTAVAGLAAAELDNQEGIAGVAGGAKVHAVSIPNWTEVEVARAINESANRANVDVINMSFGWWSWDKQIINPAIENAHDQQGVVLVAATGNENNNVIRYPATHPKVLAVGGSDQNDERKRPESPDGERWGASYGQDIDVVAPAVRCWTTDIQGANGYNSGNASAGSADGDYYKFFNGTSSATPHVAGLAGLLKSYNPSLTNVEVRDIIERTCDKVSASTYSYAHHSHKSNGAWNVEMGYGRVNVYRALRAASFTKRRYTGTHFGGTLQPNETRRQWVGPWAHWVVVDYEIRPTSEAGWISGDVAGTYRTQNGIYYLLEIENKRNQQCNFEAKYLVDYDY